MSLSETDIAEDTGVHREQSTSHGNTITRNPRRVSVGTIRYCFCDAGISSGVQEDVVVTEKKDHVDDGDGGDDDDLLSSMWMRKLFVAFCDSMAMMRMQPQMMTLLRSRHKETVREMRSKDGNEAEEPEGNKEEEEEDFEA
jgi:hypothetical protein